LKANVQNKVNVNVQDHCITAEAGGSPKHALISFNMAVALGKRLQGKPCRGASSDQMIYIEEIGRNFFPDVVIACPPMKYSDLYPNALLNPSLVVEVFSPSTEAAVRGSKFHQYELIPELCDYLLVSQEKTLVEHRMKLRENEWRIRHFCSVSEVIDIENLQISIPLSEVYDGLELPCGLTLLRGSGS
jgi:Uma2 family endonuclease